MTTMTEPQRSARTLIVTRAPHAGVREAFDAAYAVLPRDVSGAEAFAALRQQVGRYVGPPRAWVDAQAVLWALDTDRRRAAGHLARPDGTATPFNRAEHAAVMAAIKAVEALLESRTARCGSDDRRVANRCRAAGEWVREALR